MSELEIKTYHELNKYLDMFKKKYIDLLIIKGMPGVGKSYEVQEALKDTSHLFLNTHVTPLEVYKIMFDCKDEPIIIDDISTLLRSDILKSILKQCGETNDVKHIQWNSTTSKLNDYPKEFDTRSNICLICNKLKGRNDVDGLAISDRGFSIKFTPKKDEILEKMREITRKKGLEDRWEVYRFIKDNFDFAEEVNLRTLVKGFQMIEYGRDDWKEVLEEQMEVSEKLRRVKELIDKHETTNDAIKEYDKSKQTFHKYKRQLKSKGVI